MALQAYDLEESKYTTINDSVTSMVNSTPVSDRGAVFVKSAYAQPLQTEGVNQMPTQFVRTFTDKRTVMDYSTRDSVIGTQQNPGFLDRPQFNMYPAVRRETNVHNQHMDRTLTCDPSTNPLCTHNYTERFPTKTL